LLSGLIIALVGLPQGAASGTVDPEIVDNLALFYVVLATIIAAIGAWAYTLFPLGEKDHEIRMAARANPPK
jgi:GPH family glycoside/pentoside/hexuronide:cation symporter